MIERAAHRSVHLRHAAQAIGVLNPRIVRQVRLPDFTVPQEMTQMLRDRLLAGMGPRLVDARVKRGRRSLERFQAHRPGDVRDPRQTFGAEQGQATHRMHGLRSIQKRQPFLGLEDDRPQPRVLERIAARQQRPFIKRFAFADQRQRQMRQRRQIPARADRPLFRNNRMTPRFRVRRAARSLPGGSR